MSLASSIAGTPVLSSIAWSHILDGGNACDASSLNTLVKSVYCSGVFDTSGVSFPGSLLSDGRHMSSGHSIPSSGPMVTCPMKC